MQSSYNVIKKNCIIPEAVYTVKPPAPYVPEVKEDTEDQENESLKNSEEAEANAEKIINEAEQKSKMIIDSAFMEAERMKKDTFDIAYKKGYADGKLKGQEDGLKETEDIRKSAESVLKEAHRESRRYVENQREEIVGLAVLIAQKVVDCEIDMNDSIILKKVNECIENAVVKGQLIIRVNPMDYAQLDSSREILLRAIDGNTDINIIRDSNIKRGGCIIDTGLSVVDAAIDSQFEKIKEALQG